MLASIGIHPVHPSRAVSTQKRDRLMIIISFIVPSSAFLAESNRLQAIDLILMCHVLDILRVKMTFYSLINGKIHGYFIRFTLNNSSLIFHDVYGHQQVGHSVVKWYWHVYDPIVLGHLLRDYCCPANQFQACDGHHGL